MSDKLKESDVTWIDGFEAGKRAAFAAANVRANDRRFQAAVAAMQACIEWRSKDEDAFEDAADVAECAVCYADALVKALEEKP